MGRLGEGVSAYFLSGGESVEHTFHDRGSEQDVGVTETAASDVDNSDEDEDLATNASGNVDVEATTVELHSDGDDVEAGDEGNKDLDNSAEVVARGTEVGNQPDGRATERSGAAKAVLAGVQASSFGGGSCCGDFG